MNQRHKKIINKETGTETSNKLSIKEIQPGLNPLYEVEENGNISIFKFLKEGGEAERFKAEAEIYHKLNSYSNYPVPDLRSKNLSLNEPYFVLENIQSQNAGNIKRCPNQSQREKFFAQYGKYLAMLHQKVNFSYYGDLMYKNGLVVENSRSSWKAKFLDYINTYFSDSEWINDNLAEEAMETAQVSVNILPESPQPALLRIDNRLDNVLVNPNGDITAMIDWGLLASGDPLYDLMFSEYLMVDQDFDYLSKQKRQKLRYSLFEGYAEIRPFKRNKKFNKRRQLYRLAVTGFLCLGFPHWKHKLSKAERKKKENEIQQRVKTAIRTIEN